MADKERITRRAALGFLAAGAAATVGETLGFDSVVADRTVSVGVTGDSDALLGLTGYDDPAAATTVTNRSGEEMTVALDSADGTGRFDVGETGTFVADPQPFTLAAGASRSVAVRGNDGAGGTVPVDVVAAFPSGSVDLSRAFAVPVTEVSIVDLDFNPRGGGQLDEYVTFENTGSVPVDLDGWTVRDEGDVHTYEFDSLVLDPGDSVTLVTGSGTDDATTRYWGESQAVWNNGGDTASLYRPDGTLEDEASRAPGGGGSGGSGGFVIDAQRSQFDRPDGVPTSGEYVVFENTGDTAIDLNNWRVRDEADNEYRFSSFTLGPGNTVTLRTGDGDDDPDSVTDADLYWGRGLAVWNNGGDTVFVYDGPADGDNTSLVVEYSY